MTTTLAPRAAGYLLLAAGSLLVAVVFGDAPLAAVGLPALVALALAMVADAPAAGAVLEASIRLESPLARTGDEVEVTVVVVADRPVRRCLAVLELDDRLTTGGATTWSRRLPAGEPVEQRLGVSAGQPGPHRVGPLVLVVSGPMGLLRRQLDLPATTVEVRPVEISVRHLPRSLRVRVPAGEQLSRSAGDGLELAEVRPEAPGEVARRVNWRATARRGQVHVTVHHPEQATDVVLFADTFDGDHLGRVLDVTASAAAGYLSRRDRVGLVCFGGVLDWVEAASGRRQLDAIRARLAATSPFFSYAWKTIERIPPRAMPAGALVVAVSPLDDERFVAALGEVRGRGHETVVIETATPEPPVEPGTAPAREAAARLVRMEREELRHRLWLRGIAVVPLLPGDPLEGVLASLKEARRKMRPGLRR